MNDLRSTIFNALFVHHNYSHRHCCVACYIAYLCAMLCVQDACKTRCGGLDTFRRPIKVTQAFELLDCAQRCPVRLYEFYNSVCPSGRPDDAFYLRPLRNYSSTVWFESNAVGKNTLCDTVSRICKAAGFVGFFSNHSLRATAATRLFDAAIDEQLIKVKTGHASDAVRSYKRVSETKLENLTDVVACKSLK